MGCSLPQELWSPCAWSSRPSIYRSRHDIVMTPNQWRAGSVVAVINAAVAVVTVVGCGIDTLLPKVISYRQWVFDLLFRAAQPWLLGTAVITCMFLYHALKTANADKRRICLLLTVVVLGVFLLPRSLNRHKVRTQDVCYLVMNNVEKIRSQLKVVGRNSDMQSVSQALGYEPRCPCGGSYSWELNEAVRCTKHGAQYPRWIVRCLSDGCVRPK